MKADWNSCPFCSQQVTNNFSVSVSIDKPNRIATWTYNTLGAVSIILGALMFFTAQDNSQKTISAFFGIGGLYLLNATWMKNNTK